MPVAHLDDPGQNLYARFDDAGSTCVNFIPGGGLKTRRYSIADATLVTAGLAAGEYSIEVMVGFAVSASSTDASRGIIPAFRFNGTTEDKLYLSATDIATALTAQGLTSVRAAYLSNLSAGVVPTASAIATAVGAPSAISIAAAVAAQSSIATGMTGVGTLLVRLTSGRASNLDSLDSLGGPLLTTANISSQTVALTPAALSAVRDAVLGGKMYISANVNDLSPTTGAFKGNAGLNATNNFYSLGKSVVTFISGPLQGISNRVTGYVGATRTFAFAVPWPVVPANGDSFVLLGRIE